MTVHLSVALLAALCGQAAAPASDPRARDVAPFVGDEVALVAHLDLSRLDVESLALRLPGALVGVDEDERGEVAQAAAHWVTALRRAGAKDLFLLLSPADMPGPPFAVVPLAAGTDAQAIGRVLCGGGDGNEKPPYTWPTCATIRGAVFAGTTAALERARGPIPAPRPGLAAAFLATSDAPAQIILLPSADQRRVFEEMLPTLPRELGGGPSATLTRGILWIAVALEAQPKLGFRVLVQARDATTAGALLPIGQDALKQIVQAAQGQALPPELAKDLARLIPEVAGDRVVLGFDPEPAVALVAVPLRAALESSHMRRCTDNLMHIGLALHNYHNRHNAFPPAYTSDPEGHPLLSWRVHLLPFLEQQSLYGEFHLDEPWDSPHNRALIAKIPQVFVCPNEGRKLRKSGMTTYLTPRGKATIFPGDKAVKINEITDGLSNTLFAVDADDDRAVIWTRPDDWEVDPEPKKDGVFGHHSGGTNMLFADGAVRFLQETIKLSTLRKLVTGSGREILKWDDF